MGLLPLFVLFAAVANGSSNNVKFQYFSDSIGTCFSMRLYIFVMSFVLIFNVVVSGGLYFRCCLIVNVFSMTFCVAVPAVF